MFSFIKIRSVVLGLLLDGNTVILIDTPQGQERA